MSIQLPFRYLEPTFCAGLLDDPVLLIRTRPLGSNLLFDCGEIHHLAKRVLTSIEAIFISHTHMDHWMGIDTVIRHLHASSKTIDLFGPPGLVEKFGHRLSSYDWNLAEDYWGSFRIHDVHPDRIESSQFSGPEGFTRHSIGSRCREDRVIFRNRLMQVEAETCDHRVASLIFRISERPLLHIDNKKLTELGLIPGPWLKELKYRYSHPAENKGPLLALHRTASGPADLPVVDIADLCQQIGKPQDEFSIGYISDIGFNKDNQKRISNLLQNVDLLICECTFLREAKGKARTSKHLCTEDVNLLIEELCPAFFLPMHLSKTYNHRSQELYLEIDPPEGTTLLQLPVHVTHAPLRPEMLGWQEYHDPDL